MEVFIGFQMTLGHNYWPGMFILTNYFQMIDICKNNIKVYPNTVTPIKYKN